VTDVPVSEPGAPLPEAAQRRLASGAFSSGLSVTELAACDELGLRPLGLVQGFCAMQWSWYGPGAPYSTSLVGVGGGMFTGPQTSGGQGLVQQWSCPHGYVDAGHRRWGANVEQVLLERRWAEGFAAAFDRMVQEAARLGAHGIVGIADRVHRVADARILEFHLTGTAVGAEGVAPPDGGVLFTTFLAGQRLVKLVEAGFVPVAAVAALASVRMWASCVTEYLLGGQAALLGIGPGDHEIDQLAEARMTALRLARSQVHRQLGADTLHGADTATHHAEVGPGDLVIDCTLRGTRVRRVRDEGVLSPPRPTVSLA
jgi:uncharacterized protein YbjQ (UPF0145 family)